MLAETKKTSTTERPLSVKAKRLLAAHDRVVRRFAGDEPALRVGSLIWRNGVV